MSRRRVVASFGAAVLVGAAAGLLIGLLFAGRYGAAADPVTPPGSSWPVVYRCGIVTQPEDLDRCDCDCR